jgi:hypothetical protein
LLDQFNFPEQQECPWVELVVEYTEVKRQGKVSRTVARRKTKTQTVELAEPALVIDDFLKAVKDAGVFKAPGKPRTTGKGLYMRLVPESVLRKPLAPLSTQKTKLFGKDGVISLTSPSSSRKKSEAEDSASQSPDDEASQDGDASDSVPATDVTDADKGSKGYQGPRSHSRFDFENLILAAMVRLVSCWVCCCRLSRGIRFWILTHLHSPYLT